MKMAFVAPTLALGFCAFACSSAPQDEPVSATSQAIVAQPAASGNQAILLPPGAFQLCPDGSTYHPDSTTGGYSCDWRDGYFKFRDVTGNGTLGAYDPGCSPKPTDPVGEVGVPKELDGFGCSLGVVYEQYPNAEGGSPVWACRKDLMTPLHPLPYPYVTVGLPGTVPGSLLPPGSVPGSECVGAAKPEYKLVRGYCPSSADEMARSCPPAPSRVDSFLTLGPIDLLPPSGGTSSGGTSSGGTSSGGPGKPNMGCGGPCMFPPIPPG